MDFKLFINNHHVKGVPWKISLWSLFKIKKYTVISKSLSIDIHHDEYIKCCINISNNIHETECFHSLVLLPSSPLLQAFSWPFSLPGQEPDPGLFPDLWSCSPTQTKMKILLTNLGVANKKSSKTLCNLSSENMGK